MNPFDRLAVPPGVVNDTVLAPAVPTGVVAVTVVELTTLTEVAATPPIMTALAPVRFEPVIVTTVPPAVGPALGLTDTIVGGAKYAKAPVFVTVPNGVVTDTFALPAAPAGVTAVSVDELSTWTEVAATPPIVTVAGTKNPEPVMMTVVPPAVGPWLGVTAEIVGGAT